MRWEDERYVRVYTRDTADWLALSWEARAVFLFALRKCDRAGILSVGKSGTRGLAGLLGMPPEVVARALPELTSDGCLREAEASYIIPNFLEAQESRSTDAQRKRDQRERDRARVLAQGIVASPSAADKVAEMDRSVTKRDLESPAVTTGVTSGHHASPAVTPSRAVPDRAEPKEDLRTPSAPRPAKRRTPSADAPDGTDHAYTRLADALFVIFRDDRGRDPQPDGRNWAALKRLRARHPDAEIIRRWGNGVPAKFKRRTSSFVDLEAKWDECGDAEPAAGVNGARVRTADEVMGFPSRQEQEDEEQRKWIEHLNSRGTP